MTYLPYVRVYISVTAIVVISCIIITALSEQSPWRNSCLTLYRTPSIDAKRSISRCHKDLNCKMIIFGGSMGHVSICNSHANILDSRCVSLEKGHFCKYCCILSSS